jgi:hypothetical protein
LDEPDAAGALPTEILTGTSGFEALEESEAADSGSIADLEGGEAGHELAGAAFADAEEALDGVAVEVLNFQGPEFGQNLVKSVKPSWLSGHCGIPWSTIR